MTRNAQILSTGSYVPERVVTNHDLEQLMDTSDDWIRQRSGIAERRHIVAGPRPSELAHEAPPRALAAAVPGAGLGLGPVPPHGWARRRARRLRSR